MNVQVDANGALIDELDEMMQQWDQLHTYKERDRERGIYSCKNCTYLHFVFT